MTLIHHYTCHFLPFLNAQDIGKYCDCESVNDTIRTKSLNATYINRFRGLNIFDKVQPNNKCRVIDLLLSKTAQHVKTKITNISTKELCNNVKSEVIDKALLFIHITHHRQPCLPGQVIDLATKTNQALINETVYEINETAIPSNFEFINTGKMTIVEELNASSFINETEKNYFKEDSDEEKEQDIIIDDKITYDGINIQKLLQISNEYICMSNKVIYKIKQINQYTWLLEHQMNLCMKRLSSHISPDAIYKKKLCISKCKELRNKQLTANLDCIDNKNIWRFVCNNVITNKCILEHALNMYVYYLYHNIKIVKTNDIIEKEKRIIKMNQIITNLEKEQKKLHNFMKEIIEINMFTEIYRDINRMIQICKQMKDRLLKDIIESESVFNFYIFNISTYEIIKISSTIDNLMLLVNYVISEKYFNKTKISDDEFIKNHLLHHH